MKVLDLKLKEPAWSMAPDQLATLQRGVDSLQAQGGRTPVNENMLAHFQGGAEEPVGEVADEEAEPEDQDEGGDDDDSNPITEKTPGSQQIQEDSSVAAETTAGATEMKIDDITAAENRIVEQLKLMPPEIRHEKLINRIKAEGKRPILRRGREGNIIIFDDPKADEPLAEISADIVTQYGLVGDLNKLVRSRVEMPKEDQPKAE